MNKAHVTIGSALALFCLMLPGHTQRGSEADSFLARKERWAIKTGADEGAGRINLRNTRPAKVVDLIRLQRPVELPTNATSRAARTTRYTEAEKTAFTIDADIVRYKLEKDDHDFHIVIRDHDDAKAEDPPLESGQRRTMIVEVPDPSVVVSSSPWRNEIASVRREFDSTFHPSGRFTYRVHHVRITGVGYYDFIHGQSGVAPNGLELHPVTKIEILEPGRETARQPVRRAPARDTGSAVAPNGQVWVNLNSGVYWRPGTRYYGKTKKGQYMTEDEAVKAGYRAAGGQ